MKLDRSLPYATVTGHPWALYEQNGVLFDGAGQSAEPDTLREVERDTIIESDDVVSAQDFLKHILSGGPLSKSVIYKVAEDNNQSWEAVKQAYALLGVVAFTYRKATMWKLPEELAN